MLKLPYIIIFILFTAAIEAYSADSLQLTPSKRDAFMFEVDQLKFQGATSFSSEYLLSAISSRASDISYPHALIKLVDNKTAKRMYFPRELKNIIQKSLKTLEKEIKYFDKTTVEQDIAKLLNLYNSNGFHQAIITYQFYGNRNERKNILQYNIIEGPHFLIGDFRLIGLNDLDSDTKKLIGKIILPKPGDIFQESDITQAIESAMNIVLDNGYYYASYKEPTIKMDTIIYRDTVAIEIIHGKRMRYNKVTFVDDSLSLIKQSKVTDNVKNKQLEFQEGDWYSRAKTVKSVQNLYGLGVFENVSIDTSQYKYAHTDSSLSFKIFEKYNKQQDLKGAIFANRMSIDNSNTFGVEAYYLHRNIFGAAQSFYPNASVSFLSLSPLEIEYRMGAQFYQPLLWTISGQRVAFSLEPLVTIRTIHAPLKLLTGSVAGAWSVALPSKTYINGMNVAVNFEYQKPIGLASAISNIMTDAKTAQDTITIREEIYSYSQLDKFISEKSPIFTATNLSASIFGDTRDNQFSPSRGRYTSISFDLGGFFGYLIPISSISDKIGGNAKYLKTLFSNYWFWPASKNLVSALKIRAGYIFQFEKSSSIVPIDRQFFVGGGSSVRGWASRQLRYPMVTSTGAYSAGYIADLVGSSTVIEGSYELRFRFPRFAYLNEFLAGQVSQMGLVTFIDWGNAWGSFSSQSSSFKLEDLTKIAIAGGLGFRYETPVGPVRLDFALPFYDPSKKSGNTIFSTTNRWSQLTINIGLGHAF